MVEGQVVCPNCRQLVVPDFLTGADALCPSCHVLFPAQSAAAAPNARQAPPVVLTDGPGDSPQFKLDVGESPSSASSASPRPPVKRESRRPRNRQGAKGPWEIVKVVLGGAAGLGIGYLVVLWIQSRTPQPKTSPQRPQAQEVVAWAPRSERLPEIRSRPDLSSLPIAPVFSPPPIEFSPTSNRDSSTAEKTTLDSSGTGAASHAPPPSATRRELDGLPLAIKLPSLVDTASVVLCPLHVPAGKSLEISLNAVAANIPAQAALLIEPDADGGARWKCSYMHDLNAAQDKRLLGELKHAGGELSFQWHSPIEDAEARKELANCLLRLTCGSISKTAFLRVPQEVPRLGMDLERDLAVHTLPALDPPKEESLRLEIVELIGFPGSASVRDAKQLLKLKERATIEFAQLPGAEIQLEFRRHPTSGNLEVVLRPEFRENAVEKFTMTLPRLVELKTDLEKLIPEHEATLVSLGNDARAIDDELRRLGPRPGGPAFVAWQSKRTRLESALSSCKSKASKLQRRLPELKARLAVAPKLEQFLRNMHEHASLKVKLLAECGEARLVVLDARLNPLPHQEIEVR